MADTKNLFISVKVTQIPIPVAEPPVIEAVTPEQYAALTPEQIAAGIYFVSEDAGNSNG